MRLGGRAALAVALAALCLACSAPGASAHASLISSDPAAGASLGATPTEITLSLSERPIAALSSITVVDDRGGTYQSGRAESAPGDPLTIAVPIRSLARGVYTVRWRVDSAVDGHATTGAYQFGVQEPPAGAGTGSVRTTTSAVTSTLELVARWILLVGLVALIGAASAAVARFGGSGRADMSLAGGAWLLSVIGLLLLADAQRHNAGSSLTALLRTSVGHALIWRAVAIAVAGVALLVASGGSRIWRRVALGVAGLAALAAVIVHVANGHADASKWPSAITVTFQTVHFAVAGVWIGGLAALLVGIRGAPTSEKAMAVRRFSIIAAAGLGLIVVTGIVRAFSELRSWDQLFSTGYGRAVLAKLALVGLIAFVAARNRDRVGVSRANLRPLRRSGRIELALAAGALAVAALLGTLAPPVAGRTSGLRGLEASGTDVSHTVRVELRAFSDEPGPNRFTATVSRYGSGRPVQGASVRLLFTPLDDPGIASSSLGMTPAPGGTYVASGANMQFDGRWGVRVLVARAGESLDVPLELDPVGPPQRVTIEHIAGEATTYTKLVGPPGFIRISPHPQRAGRSVLAVTFYAASTGDYEGMKQVVVTVAARNGPVRQQVVRQVGVGSYASDVDLPAGRDEIAVIARRSDGTRLRSVFDLEIPSR